MRPFQPVSPQCGLVFFLSVSLSSRMNSFPEKSLSIFSPPFQFSAIHSDSDPFKIWMLAIGLLAHVLVCSLAFGCLMLASRACSAALTRSLVRSSPSSWGSSIMCVGEFLKNVTNPVAVAHVWISETYLQKFISLIAHTTATDARTRESFGLKGA